jgi:hypothetical protein
MKKETYVKPGSREVQRSLDDIGAVIENRKIFRVLSTRSASRSSSDQMPNQQVAARSVHGLTKGIKVRDKMDACLN